MNVTSEPSAGVVDCDIGMSGLDHEPPVLGAFGSDAGSLVTVALLLFGLGALVVLTFVNPWVFTADDSLFYLVVGRHIAATGAWTFNGLTPTNGVQPLWQLVTAGVESVGRVVGVRSAVGLLRSVLVVNWVLAALALASMWRLLSRLRVPDPYRLLGVVVLGCALCGPWGMFASEAHAVAVSMLLMLLLVRSWIGEPSTRLALGIGFTGGLMMLARLDTIWIVAVTLAVMTVVSLEYPVRRRLSDLVATATAMVAVLTPYLVWNIVRFGHLIPISGAIKVDVGSPRWSLDGVGPEAVLMLALVWVGGRLSVIRSPRRTDRIVVWAIPSLGATVSSLFYVAFSRGAYTAWWWYLVPHAMALALTAAFVGADMAERFRTKERFLSMLTVLGCVLLAGAAVFFCATRLLVGPVEQIWSDALSFSSEVSDKVPENAPMVTVDMPGVLGLTSGRPVVALDGLTGDFAFQDRWRRNGVACAVGDLGVRYLVTVKDRSVSKRDDHSVTVRMSSWLYWERPTVLHGRGPLLAAPGSAYQLWELDDTCVR